MPALTLEIPNNPVTTADDGSCPELIPVPQSRPGQEPVQMLRVLRCMTVPCCWSFLVHEGAAACLNRATGAGPSDKMEVEAPAVRQVRI